MALTIINEPNSLLPIPVRNPIEIALETDNYIQYIVGIQKKLKVHFNYLSEYEVGNTFQLKCDNDIITFSFSTTPANQNQLLPRSNFQPYLAGDLDYGYYLKDRFNSHSIISAHFVALTVFQTGTLGTETHISFVSTINENVDFTFSNFTGGGAQSYTHYDIQTGIKDEYLDRPTIFKIGMYFNAQGNPVNGDTFTLKIENTNYTFLFSANPNNLGYELPLRGGLSLVDYQNLLLQRLMGAPCFTDKFEVTTSIWVNEIHFTFTSIGYVEGEITNTNNSSRYVWVNLPGYKALYQPNFTANLRLYCEKNYQSNDFEKIIDLYAYPKNQPIASENHFLCNFKLDKLLYDFMNKTYNENLAAALPYTINYPKANHLFKKFYFHYNENYGEPATDKLISNSGKYIAALHGIGHLSFINRKQLQSFGFLHPSGDKDNPLFLKQYVDKDQQLWLYFFIQPSDGNEIGGVTRPYIIVYYDDGSTYTADFAPGAAYAVPNNECKAFFIPVGYYQRGVGNGNILGKQAYMWDIVIEIDGDDYRLTKRFVLDCCSTYKSYLMYQNSYGGYDTVLITAPKEFSLELTDGKEVERILPSDYTIHDSQFEATIPKVRKNIKANLGYKKASDFDVLQELLMSKYVFLLPKGSSEVFIPINIDRKTVQLESEDDFEKTFSFEFSPAHEFKNYENSLWLK